MAKQPVRLYVFYHDDVDEGTRRIVPRQYLKDCIIELQKVTGREFIIEYRHSLPGITDFDYQGNADQTLSQWRDIARDYADQHGISSDGIQRFLLVTQQALEEDVLGIAYLNGEHLIASLTAYQTIAHELGHTFGATHEDAELQHNSFGIPCATYLYPEHSPLRANCYHYSAKNRENIAQFFAHRD